MRRLLIIGLLSIAFAVAMHVIPVLYDTFSLAEVQGQQIKVFHRGWPIPYVFEGPLQDPIGLLVMKCALNVALMFFGVWLVTTLWNKAQVRGGSTCLAPRLRKSEQRKNE